MVLRFGLSSSLMWGLFISYHTGGSEIWSVKLPDVRFVLYLTIQVVLRFGLSSSLMWGLYYNLPYRWFWDLVCQAPWCEVCIISYHTGGSEIWSVKLPDVRFCLDGFLQQNNSMWLQLQVFNLTLQLGNEFYLFVSHGGMNDRGSTCKFRNARSAFRNLHMDPLSFIPPWEPNK